MVTAEYNSNIIDFLMPSFKLKRNDPSANKVNFSSSNGYFILIQADVTATSWISQTAFWISRVFQRTLAAKSQVVMFLYSLKVVDETFHFGSRMLLLQPPWRTEGLSQLRREEMSVLYEPNLRLCSCAGQHVPLFSF